MLTGRLVTLRPIETGDLDVLTRLTNDLVVRGSVVGWDLPVARGGQDAWLDSSRQSGRTTRFAVVNKADQSVVGMTGLWDIDWHNQQALSAVKLLPGLAPKGAGTDTIMLMNAWAFYDVGLRRLHGSILDFNGPSLGAYLSKGGWRLEGRERQSTFRKGQWHDLLRVAILRSDFDALPDASEYVDYVCPVDVDAKAEVPPGD